MKKLVALLAIVVMLVSVQSASAFSLVKYWDTGHGSDFQTWTGTCGGGGYTCVAWVDAAYASGAYAAVSGNGGSVVADVYTAGYGYDSDSGTLYDTCDWEITLYLSTVMGEVYAAINP